MKWLGILWFWWSLHPFRITDKKRVLPKNNVEHENGTKMAPRWLTWNTNTWAVLEPFPSPKMTPTYAGCPPKSFRVNFLPIDVSSMLVIAGVGWHDSLTLNSWGGSCLRPCKWSMLKHVKTTLTGTPGVGWHDSFTFTFEDVLHTSTIVNMEACGQNDFSMIFP